MKKYSEAIKLEARKLVRSGLTRRETGRQLGLDDRLICIWCADIPATKGKAFSRELVEKAKSLVLSGKSKRIVAKEIGVSYEWIKYHTKGVESRKTIPKETEDKTKQLVASGIQKKEVAKMLGLSYQWVKRHTNPSYHFTQYPQKLKESVQRLGEQGFNAPFIERAFGLKSRTARTWLGYKNKRKYLIIGGRSLAILQKLMERHWFIPKGRQMDACRILSRQLPIKIVRYNQKKRICLLPGNENEAIAAFVARYYNNRLGSRRLKRILVKFGVIYTNRKLIKKVYSI